MWRGSVSIQKVAIDCLFLGIVIWKGAGRRPVAWHTAQAFPVDFVADALRGALGLDAAASRLTCASRSSRASRNCAVLRSLVAFCSSMISFAARVVFSIAVSARGFTPLNGRGCDGFVIVQAPVWPKIKSRAPSARTPCPKRCRQICRAVHLRERSIWLIRRPTHAGSRCNRPGCGSWHRLCLHSGKPQGAPGVCRICPSFFPRSRVSRLPRRQTGAQRKLERRILSHALVAPFKSSLAPTQ